MAQRGQRGRVSDGEPSAVHPETKLVRLWIPYLLWQRIYRQAFRDREEMCEVEGHDSYGCSVGGVIRRTLAEAFPPEKRLEP